MLCEEFVRMLGIFACLFHSRKVSSLEYYLWFLLLHTCTFVVHFCIGCVEKIRDVEEMMKDFLCKFLKL